MVAWRIVQSYESWPGARSPRGWMNAGDSLSNFGRGGEPRKHGLKSEGFVHVTQNCDQRLGRNVTPLKLARKGHSSGHQRALQPVRIEPFHDHKSLAGWSFLRTDNRCSLWHFLQNPVSFPRRFLPSETGPSHRRHFLIPGSQKVMESLHQRPPWLPACLKALSEPLEDLEAQVEFRRHRGCRCCSNRP